MSDRYEVKFDWNGQTRYGVVSNFGKEAEVDSGRRKRLRKEGLWLKFLGFKKEKQFEILCLLTDPKNKAKYRHRRNTGNILRKWVENPTEFLKRKLKNFLLRQWHNDRRLAKAI